MTERDGPPEPGAADQPPAQSPPGDEAPPAGHGGDSDTPLGGEGAGPAETGQATSAAWEPTPPPATPPMPPAQPLVGWAPSPAPAPAVGDGYAGGPPRYTVGALLSDTFARYGADPLRIFVLSALATVLSYASSFMGGNPLVPQPTGFVDLSGILGLLGFVVGILTGSIILALLDGGPRMPIARSIRRGVERAGWMFLTAVVLGLGAIVVLLIAAIPLVLLAINSPAAAFVLFLAVGLVFVWLYMRLGFAIVANVVDNVNTVDAIKLSWRVTGPAGVWLRVLACSILLGLLVLPASLLALVVFFVGVVSDPLLFVVAGLLLGLLAPLASILLYSAYRRLVPPIQPHWTAPPAPAAPAGTMPALPAMPAPAPDASAMIAPAPPPGPADAPAPGSTEPAIPPLAPLVGWDTSGPAAAQAPASMPGLAAAAPAPAATAPSDTAAWGVPAASVAAPSAEPSRPAFRAPRFDAGAKFVVALVMLLGVVGIGSFGWLVGEVVAGRVALPTFPTTPNQPGFPGFPSLDGSVDPGTVAFGTAADLDTCTIEGQTFFAPRTMDVHWIAAFSRRTTATDAITFRVTLDGTEILNIQESPGVYDCLGTDAPEQDLSPGLYTFEFYLNGTLDASGTLIVS